MAVTADFDRFNGQARRTGEGLVLDVDRPRAFRVAKRHTFLVRALRVVMPVSIVATIGLYSVAIAFRASLQDVLPALPVPEILSANLTMHNPHYDGYNKDGGSYSLTAVTAVQPLTTPNIIELNTITAKVIDAAKVKTDLTATRGTYDSKSGQLELFDAIDISSASGMKAKLTRASVQTKEGLIVSQEPVAVSMPSGSVRALTMTVRQKLKEMTFVNSVVARLEPPQSRPGQNFIGATAAAPADNPVAANSPRLLGGSGGPIDVVSNRLDVSDLAKTALFTGAVKAVQNDAVLATPELLVTYEGGSPETGSPPAAASATPASGKLKRLDAKGPVVLTRGTLERVTAESLTYDASSQTAVLDGKVVMVAGADRQLTGDRVEIDEARDTLRVTGNVNAAQGRNQLAGGQLFVNNKTATTVLTAQPAANGASGRIKARFYQTESAKKPKRQPAEGGAAVGRFQTDPAAPVDVVADRLDVDDKAKSAIFRGDVRAFQGEFLIRTSELEATYSGAAGASDPQPQVEGSKATEPAKLLRIQARRKVVVTSAASQSATGDWADFNIRTNKAVIGGDVILTQGPNIIRGTKLVIDMTTGESMLQNDATAGSASAAQANGDDPISGTIKRDRPSAVLFPKSFEQKPKPSRSSIDGWAATSQSVGQSKD